MKPCSCNSWGIFPASGGNCLGQSEEPHLKNKGVYSTDKQPLENFNLFFKTYPHNKEFCCLACNGQTREIGVSRTQKIKTKQKLKILTK